MFRNNPFLTRLAYQLVPAALVTAVGVLVLSNVAKTPDPAPAATTAPAPITGEAVFTATPREAARAVAEEPEAKSTAPRAAKPKAVANAAPRKNEPAPPRQTANLPPPPLPSLAVVEPPKPAPDTSVMGRLKSATATVTAIPRWAASSVSGWFSEGAPPRPPAPVPAQNFQASM